MDVSIKILVENTTPIPGIIGEYGFAALVTINGRSFLFDTGSDRAIIQNALTMGIKLDKVEELVLSHGHFDHTGAVLPLVKSFGIRKIYVHSNLFAHRLLPLKNGSMRNIGCVFTRAEVEDAGAKIIFTDDFTFIGEGVCVTGKIPRLTDYEDIGGKFKVEVNSVLQDDNLDDDMAMVITHPKGLIIISGCAHSGIINTINYAMQQTGEQRILAFIGGTHLMTASQLRIDETINTLKSYNIENLIVGHCTGFYAAARLYNALGSVVKKADAGMCLDFK